MEAISSLHNPLIKRIRNLKQKKYRTREKLFLLEGIRILEEALHKDWPLHSVLYSSRLLDSERGQALHALCAKRGVPLYPCTPKVLSALTDTETDQGVIAVAEQRQDNWQSVWRKKENLLAVLVDGVQDPGNLGTIIRTAAALAADAVFLSRGTTDLYSEKTVRSTMGALFYLPVFAVDDLAGFLSEVKEQGIVLAAGDLDAELYCSQADFVQPLMLCLGNEGNGISQTVRDMADLKVRIPMPGRTESFNVGIASGILLYEAVRQRLEGK
ncbi:MAG: TrmH family RNA methyltransferase [bacterium]